MVGRIQADYDTKVVVRIGESYNYLNSIAFAYNLLQSIDRQYKGLHTLLFYKIGSHFIFLWYQFQLLLFRY